MVNGIHPALTAFLKNRLHGDTTILSRVDDTDSFRLNPASDIADFLHAVDLKTKGDNALQDMRKKVASISALETNLDEGSGFISTIKLLDKKAGRGAQRYNRPADKEAVIQELRSSLTKYLPFAPDSKEQPTKLAELKETFTKLGETLSANDTTNPLVVLGKVAKGILDRLNTEFPVNK